MAKDTPTKPPGKPLTTPISIHLALAAIIQAIDAVPKSRQFGKEGESGPRYKFRGIEDVMNSLHPILAANGVVLLPSTENLTLADFKNGKGNQIFRTTITIKYKVLASDGTFVEASFTGDAFDFGDKALPKAQSMALKNMLTHMFLIPTADIADADKDNFNIDAAAAARAEPGAEYNGKTYKQLLALRDSLIEGGTQPPAALLGKIAELRCLEADKQAEGAVKPDTKKEPEKAATKAAEKPTEKAPENPPVETKAEPTPEQAAAPAGDANALLEYEIHVLKHKTYRGKKLGQLELKDLETIEKGWCANPSLQAEIEKNPEAVKERENIRAMMEIWKKTPQPGK